ncbi:MAG: DUF502 domain-containing protein [Gemmatimonadaceae bacterium]|nr:DUF502 domain-containing protein [Gemmatimonadaceae bacterium]
MRRLAGYFLRGLVIMAPLALTVYVCFSIVTAIDSWIPVDIPGVGFAITIGLITLVGALGSNVLTDGLVRLIDGLLEKLPFVRLLYGTAKDFFEAFAGEKKRFDTAVLVTLYPASEAKALGFMTRRDVEMFGLVNHVAVYLPHSYAFTGQLILVPAEHVTLVQAGSAELMTFIVSAGVTEKSGSTFGGSTSSSNTPDTPLQAVSLMPAHGVDPAS